MTLSTVLNEYKYIVIKELHQEKGYPVAQLCASENINVNRGAYYKWLKRKKSVNEVYNERLLTYIKEAYEDKDGILGYRQMTIVLDREYNQKVNEKRVLRLMRIIGLKAVIRRKRPAYVRSTPEVVAENILNREFKADSFNEKWLTDVTEFKYGNAGEKAYLSAILDLGDRHIVSFVIGHSNNNKLVFDTFKSAVKLNPSAHPLFHSD